MYLVNALDIQRVLRSLWKHNFGLFQAMMRWEFKPWNFAYQMEGLQIKEIGQVGCSLALNSRTTIGPLAWIMRLQALGPQHQIWLQPTGLLEDFEILHALQRPNSLWYLCRMVTIKEKEQVEKEKKKEPI